MQLKFIYPNTGYAEIRWLALTETFFTAVKGRRLYSIRWNYTITSTKSSTVRRRLHKASATHAVAALLYGFANN